MKRLLNASHVLPRRYRHYPYLFLLICLLIFLILIQHRSNSNVEEIVSHEVENIFDLFNDDDTPLICPPGIQFNILNRQHLAIFVGPKLVTFLWKNFQALLCTGVDAYIMLNEPFVNQSSLRDVAFQPSHNRSQRSYTYRFLYVPDDLLAKYGVSFMTKFPQVRYAAWDRVVVWLYQRKHLKTAWVIDYRLHWLHVQNITDFFDLFKTDPSDILCTDIVPTNTRHWLQWPHKNSDIFPKSSWLGTFSPVVRWSRRLLLHHYRYMQLMHVKRLNYEIDPSFRFQEFLMATIANIEKLSISLFNQKYQNAHITLGDFNDRDILTFIRRGQHIIYPIQQDSILTNLGTEEILKMMKQA